MNLTFLQSLELTYWSLFEIRKFNGYQYWLSIGLQPRYAFEKVKNNN